MTPPDVTYFATGTVSKLDPQTPGWVEVETTPYGTAAPVRCQVVTARGGPGRGVVFLPEVGDHVFLAFEGGRATAAYVLGAVWSDRQKPPAGDGKPADNNVRFIRSRSGHQIKLDDTKGKERIEVVDKDGARRVVIDSAGKKIRVVCDSGDVEVKAGAGKVSVEASGEVKVKGATVTVESDGALTVKAKGVLTLKGSKVDINPPGAA